MANNLLPARGGDAVRCLLVKTDRVYRSASATLGTLAIEKLQDGLTLVLVVAGSMPFWRPPVWLRHLAVSGGLLLGAALAAVVVLTVRPLPFRRALEAAGRRLKIEAGRSVVRPQVRQAAGRRRNSRYFGR